MNPAVQTPRRFRGGVSLDVAPKLSGKRGVVRRDFDPSTQDFSSKPLRSTMFFRGSRIFFNTRSGAEVVRKRSVEDIRPRFSRTHVGERRFARISAWRRYASWFGEFERCIVRGGGLFALSPRLSIRLSLVGMVFLGAALTMLSYRYLGERALAREESQNVAKTDGERPATVSESPAASDTSDQTDDRFVNEVSDDLESLREVKKKEEFETKIREMVAGYPIEDMVPYILGKDKIVAAFLIGIAKKESAWGKRVPLLKSHDCFNYWGYRGKRRFMGTGGHTCFNSPKDAVDTVSRRLEKLVYTEKIDTPAEMMVAWKCGYDCSAHSKADMKKWIQDVDIYFHQLDE